jgi:hypothetical protein
LRVIVQDHADKLIQAVVGSDVDLWGASEKVTQASSAFIVDVRIDQFDRNTLSEASVLEKKKLPSLSNPRSTPNRRCTRWS